MDPTTDLLDLLADGTHPGSRVRFLDHSEAPAMPLEQVWASSETAAGWIRRHHGEQPVVAATLTASHPSLSCLLGTWRAGGRLVSIPARARGQSAEDYRAQVEGCCGAAQATVLLTGDPAHPDLAGLTVPVASFEAALDGPRFSERVGGGDLVQFSSGTTGSPKGVVLDQAAIAANVRGILGRLDIREPGAFVLVAPAVPRHGPHRHVPGAVGRLRPRLRHGRGDDPHSHRVVRQEPSHLDAGLLGPPRRGHHRSHLRLRDGGSTPLPGEAARPERPARLHRGGGADPGGDPSGLRRGGRRPTGSTQRLSARPTGWPRRCWP